MAKPNQCIAYRNKKVDLKDEYYEYRQLTAVWLLFC